MSKFKSCKNSFLHIYEKYGASSVKNHYFIKLLREKHDVAESWFLIEKAVAQVLVQIEETKEMVMCKEIEVDKQQHKDEAYVTVLKEDLNDKLEFPAEWKTFIINFQT